MKTKQQIQPADPLRANENAFALASASANDKPLPVWDDGWGKPWVIWDNCGHWVYPIGIVRARTWEDACECAVDEIFPGPDESEMEEIEAAGDELPEGFGYRGSGEPSNEREFPHIHSLYARVSLDISNPVQKLTKALMEEHGIELNYQLY